MLIQQIVSGLAAGSLYALAALGLVLIYKTSDLVNFAQGEMAMVSTFVCYTFLHLWGFNYWSSFLLALVFAAIFGILIERIFMRPVQKAPVLSQIILTLGLYMAFRGIAGQIWGHNPIPFPEAVTGDAISLGNILVRPNQIFIIGLTLVLMLLFFCLFRFTKVGLAMRAAAQNFRTAQLMGIRVGTVFSITWALSIVLGGVAGILIAPTTYLGPTMMGELLIKAFAAAVLGGFTSLPGAVIGGLLLGVFENLIAAYVSAELKTAFVFFLVIFILYIKPTGIIGVRQVKKV